VTATPTKTKTRTKTKMRTKTQIDKEIAALKALKPVGVWADKTARSIRTAIEELEHGVDQTSSEWEEMPEAQQDVVHVAIAWRDGMVEAPSRGWGGLVTKPRKARQKK
jgi:argininosuccinate lyase